MKEFFRSYWHSQWVSHKNIVPIHRFDSVRRIFHINTPAGQIKWRPKNTMPGKFRDKYINMVDILAKKRQEGRDITRDSFKLYRQMRKDFKVSYSANIRTRVRGVGEWILSTLIFKTS